MIPRHADAGGTFPILEFRLHGDGFHPPHETSILSDEHDELFERGRQSLGDLGHSLLRSEIYGKRRHRHRRLASLTRERQELDEAIAVARATGNETALGQASLDYALLVWEHIGVLAEFCEQLASMFHAATVHSAVPQSFGQALLAFNQPAWRVLAKDSFNDLDWWTDKLGIQGVVPVSLRESLTSGALEMAETMFRDARAELPRALANVVRTYTRELHRVAQRRKHAFPILTQYGFAWQVQHRSSDIQLVNEVTEHSAFTVVDSWKDEPTGLLVPGDRWATEHVLEANASADWLLHMLTTALLSAAENRTGLPLTLMSVGRKWPVEDRKSLLRAYTGYSDATYEGLAAERAIREAQLAAARKKIADQSSGGAEYPGLGRNEPCWCGSGRKFKRCHGK